MSYMDIGLGFYSTDLNELTKFKLYIDTILKNSNSDVVEVKSIFEFFAIDLYGCDTYDMGIIEEEYINNICNNTVNDTEYFYFVMVQQDNDYDYIELWKKLIDSLGININFVYSIEVYETDEYINNDIEGIVFNERYYIYCDVDGSQYFSNEEDTLNYLKDLDSSFNNCSNVEDAKEVAERLVDEEIYDFFDIIKFCYSIDEWDTNNL